MAVLEIHFLDVGQGDSTFISCPKGQKILVDFGTVKNGAVVVPDAMTFLEKQFAKNSKLDLLVVTHADQDHYNRIKLLVETLGLIVVEVWISGVIDDYWVDHFNDYLKLLEKRGTRVRTFPPNARADKSLKKPTISFGEVDFYLLSANLNYRMYPDPNPYSIVLMVAYEDVRCVLPGDATWVTENEIVEYFGKAKLASSALKLGHHGSNVTSSGDAWVAAINPNALFVSSDNRFKHPSCAVINRFTNIETLDWKHQWYCYDESLGDYKVVDSPKAVCTSMIDVDQGVQWTLYIPGETSLWQIGSTNY
jgi:competence protein ComEC